MCPEKLHSTKARFGPRCSNKKLPISVRAFMALKPFRRMKIFSKRFEIKVFHLFVIFCMSWEASFESSTLLITFASYKKRKQRRRIRGGGGMKPISGVNSFQQRISKKIPHLWVIFRKSWEASFDLSTLWTTFFSCEVTNQRWSVQGVETILWDRKILRRIKNGVFHLFVIFCMSREASFDLSTLWTTFF